MSARYFTKVADDLLPAIRDPDNIGRCGLTLIREVERRPGGWTLVEFEDAEAPPELEGKVVTPNISRSGYDPEAIWISDRWVDPGSTWTGGTDG